LKIDESKILLLLSGILCGIVIAAFLVKSPGNPIRYLTYQQYMNGNSDINSLNSEIKGLYKEESDLENKLNKYNSSGENSKVVVDTLKKELDDIKKFYGMTDVTGKGIMITIDDRHIYNSTDEYDILDSITHDEDLLKTIYDLVNEGGAEAVSVNGYRMVGNSFIKCAGPVTTVDNEYIAPPFVIKAIGDPDLLEKAFLEGYYIPLKYRGLSISIKKVSIIKINGLNNNDPNQ
jgi:uncharacterized protein YlxW (UPF0749 family)